MQCSCLDLRQFYRRLVSVFQFAVLQNPDIELTGMADKRPVRLSGVASESEVAHVTLMVACDSNIATSWKLTGVRLRPVKLIVDSGAFGPIRMQVTSWFNQSSTTSVERMR